MVKNTLLVVALLLDATTVNLEVEGLSGQTDR
jgi:hypothetical protein